MAGNTHPDHDTIATFRRRLAGEIQALIVQVLLIGCNVKRMHRMQCT